MGQERLPWRGLWARRAEAFHAANPHVLDRLRALALELVARGHARYSIKGLFEIVRWEHALRTTSADGWKLNNGFTAFYSRAVAAADPRLAEFFWHRRSDSDPPRAAVSREPERVA